MSEHFDFESRDDNDEVIITVTSGDRALKITRRNTLLRTFDEGDGEYDHCVRFQIDGTVSAFPASEELKEILTDNNVPTRHDAEIDVATIDYFATLKRIGLDTMDLDEVFRGF